MGLPQINIVFKSLATSAIERSQRGIVALIINDTVATEKTYIFKKISDVKKIDFDANNYDYLKLAFLGNPTKVIVEVISESNQRNLENVLKDLETKQFNYLTMPKIDKSEVQEISNWITTCRKNGKMYKAVLPNCKANSEAVVNFTTNDIKVDETTYTTEEYCARIAGILAGLSLTRSATYFVLDEVESIKEHEAPDEDIDNGELILINDGVKIKIARGVNSFTTTTDNKSDDFKKIKIVETMDIIYEDIRRTFEDQYVGKVSNSYDNKVIFLAAVNAYFKQLQKDGVLDSSSDAIAEIDINAQEKYLNEKHIDTESLDEQALKEANTGSSVFFTANIKPLDAMEDLDFNIYI
jgi:hypothetical protein